MTASFSSERHLYAALAAPLNAISANVTLSLRALRPDKHVTFTELFSFDVDTFAYDGHCDRTARADLPPVFRLIRNEAAGLEEDVCHGWFDVRWQGHGLEVVSLSWIQDSCTERFSWVIAPSREIAESFVDAVSKYVSAAREWWLRVSVRADTAERWRARIPG